MTTDDRIRGIEDQMDKLPDQYVPREELKALMALRDDDISDLGKQLDKQENNKRAYIGNIPSWISVVIAIISLVIALSH